MKSRDAKIAVFALAAIGAHVWLRFGLNVAPPIARVPLLAALVIGGVPLIAGLARQLMARQAGSDLLAGIAICTSAWLGEYLIASIVVLMLAGGQALEAFATRRASSMLDALARRHPGTAHRVDGEHLVDVPIADVRPGDRLVVLPNEVCPVDGVVTAGSSTMDEAYLSGEPYLIAKTVGAAVMSGAINGENALTISAERLAVDSRYARIMTIVRAAASERTGMRRLADRLGGGYTPVAVAIAAISWYASGDPSRFLAVLVIATPCPLLLAIPVAIMGATSTAARRGIVIKDPTVLERIGSCRTAIFDKTGTLTAGTPALTDVICAPGFDRRDVLKRVASVEQYSRHPLAAAIVAAADREQLSRVVVDEVRERPGEGLTAAVDGQRIRLTHRAKIPAAQRAGLPDDAGGLECLVLIDDAWAAVLRFRDVARPESHLFVGHLGPRHGIDRLLLVSGDRESETRYLASVVGIQNVYFSQSPEDKVAIVKAETQARPTLFVGDGLNDAAAMFAATVGVAMGNQNEITAQAAGAVVLDGSLSSVDELMHIARRARRIALQSAMGGMAASVIGMMLASAGWLPPLSGAIAQEVIDVAAVLNALRAAWPPRIGIDYQARD